MTTPGLKESSLEHGTRAPRWIPSPTLQSTLGECVTGSLDVSSGHPLPLAEDCGEDTAAQDEGMIWNT